MGRIEKVELFLLKPGQVADFFALLCEKAAKTTKDGKPFYALKFRDRRRTVSCPVWEDSHIYASCHSGWEIGHHFKVRGAYTEHPRFGPQVEIHNIRLVEPTDQLDGYAPDMFTVKTRYDVAELFARLLDYASSIEDEPLRRLVVGLLEANRSAIESHPAATWNHHAFHGGYLEHTVSVVENGVFLAEKYRRLYPELSPPLSRDLVVAGCVLHDIGKLHELEWVAEDPAYTSAGHLIGHILLGRDMIRDAARAIPELNPRLLLLLEHIIVSHQGTAEWGSPKEPMFPEALIVHFADDLDAKVNMFVNIVDRHEGNAAFTDSANVLRRRLLKDRSI